MLSPYRHTTTEALAFPRRARARTRVRWWPATWRFSPLEAAVWGGLVFAAIVFFPYR